MKRGIITIFSLTIAIAAFAQIGKGYHLDNYTEISGVSHAKAATTDSQIFGQVHYDQAGSMPSQANLLVQLIDQGTDNGPQKIISEAHLPASTSGRTEFKLPMHMNQLNKAHQYSLKARISIGDSLIYVSETPTLIDVNQSGYVIRLASIGQHQQTTPQRQGIAGSQWIAREINNMAISQDSNINLMINSAATTPMLGIDNGAALANRYTVNGSGGCNRFFSTALINENSSSLIFDPLGMTFISCTEKVADQENRFVNMMSKVRSYEIDKDNMLNLKDGYNHIIARFSANNSI